MNQRKCVSVMWTGGFDSTFRVCQLAKLDIDIQPYYFYNKDRKSASIEMHTIKKLLRMIRSKETTKARFLKPIVRNVDEFSPIDREYKEAYKRIRLHEQVGNQYRWMAQMSKEIPDLELTIEITKDSTKDDRFLDAIPLVASLDKHESGVLSYYKLNKDNKNNKNKNWYTLLKNFRFPAEIAHMTKEDILDAFITNGDEDIMKETWFCQLPINGEACGYCGPCRQVVQEKMEFRMKPETLNRYKHRYIYLLKYKVKKVVLVLLGKEKL